MVKSKQLILLFLMLCSASSLVGQDRYMVFFTDKNNSPYSIDSPEEFLSSNAILRTGREAINEGDLPVNEEYVSGLKNEGIEVLNTTKWMNGALVEATALQMDLLNLQFVNNYEYVAPGGKPQAGGRMESKDEGKNGKNELTFVQNNILGIPEMHSDGYTGKGVRIAVLDAGFIGIDENAYLKHAYDGNRINMTYDIVRNSEFVYSYDYHGGYVLSIFGAYLESSYIGGGYEANFDLFITEETGAENRIEEYNWLIAAEKADSAGVDILTTSLAYFEFDNPAMDYTIEDLDGQTAIITQAAELTFSKGILVIKSAGNEGDKSWGKITFPADGPNVLTVGAINSINYTIANFSSTGPTANGVLKPEVVAVGEGTTFINSTSVISTGDGTSYAAPLIAGLAAGLWQKYPELSNVELRELIIQSGNNYNSPDNIYGHGIPNYVRASRIIEGIETGMIENESNSIILYPNPVNDKYVNIRFEDSIKNGSIEIYNMHGQLMSRDLTNERTEQKLDVSSLTKGMYWVIIQSQQQNFQTSLIIE